jgi:hypothetical protein
MPGISMMPDQKCCGKLAGHNNMVGTLAPCCYVAEVQLEEAAMHEQGTHSRTGRCVDVASQHLAQQPKIQAQGPGQPRLQRPIQ